MRTKHPGPVARFRRFGGMLVALLITLSLAACEERQGLVEAEPVTRPAKLYTVPSPELWENRTFPGKVAASEKVELAFRVGGQVVELPVNEGDRVEAGDLLAKLDEKDFLASLNEIRSRITGAQATVQEAKLNFERSEELLQQDVISRSAYDQALSTYENARASLGSLQEQARQAALNLEYATLRAPFAGVIAEVFIKNFQNVQAQEPVLRLEDLSNIDILVEIPEFVWARITQRDDKGRTPPAVANFATLPDRNFILQLKEYQTRANPQTQTYTVTLTMPQPNELEVYPGMTAEITGFLPKGATEVAVPVEAVFGGPEGGQFVWLVAMDTMSVMEQPVETGRLAGGFITIVSGLEPGETVVAAGVHSLQPGQTVRPLEPLQNATSSAILPPEPEAPPTLPEPEPAS